MYNKYFHVIIIIQSFRAQKLVFTLNYSFSGIDFSEKISSGLNYRRSGNFECQNIFICRSNNEN